MEIYPELQLAMLLGAFLGGVCLGGVWELLCASRILLFAYTAPEFMRERYARPLPLLHRSVSFERKGGANKLWRGIVIGVGDLLFCLLFAVLIILLLYRYNDGEIRCSVPVLALLGLALFRTASSRFLTLVEAYLAYGIAAGWLYLRALLSLPPRGMRYLLTRFVLRPARRAYRHIELRRMRQRSAALCTMQLKWAERGFEGKCPEVCERKGRMRYEKKDRGQNNTDAVDDPHPCFAHIRGGACNRRKSTDGMEPTAPAGRGASAGEGVVSK